MNTSKEQGFTIIELMAVLLIIAISIMVAAPNFSNIIKKNNVVAAANELTGLMQYAKSTALTTNLPTVVCPLKPYNLNNTTTKEQATCVTSQTEFNSATKVGVFKYKSDGKTELVRSINLPKSVSLTDTTNKTQSIAFYPDSSAGIHGINTKLSYYKDDGSYDNNSLDLGSLKFPSDPTSTVQWQIKSNPSMANNKCYLVNIGRLGKPEVKEDGCQ